MKIVISPPKKKNTAITIANVNLLVGVIHAATKAPENVPRACAKKGNKKCFGSNKCMEARSPSEVVTSAPLGGGMTEALMETKAPLTKLPITIPKTIAMIFLRIGFIMINN